MKWAVAAMLVSSAAMANPKSTPYDPGRITIDMGVYVANRDARGVRIGAGYYVRRGLELGFAGTHFWGIPNVEAIEPLVTYHFSDSYEQFPVVPYLGLGYEHRWTEPNYYVPDMLTVRAGIDITLARGPYPVLFGGGIAWKHPLTECGFGDCRLYEKNQDEFGPQVFVGVGF